MSTFDFGLNNVQATSSSKRLKPWEIHKVKFMGCKLDTIKGKKDPEKTYEVLKVRWENANGYFEEPVFAPTSAKDAERPTYDRSDGTKAEMPSSVERMKTLIAQVAKITNPEKYDKFKEMSKQFKTFGDMCKGLVLVTDSKKNTEMYLKLAGRTDKDGNVVPCLPKFVSINRDGEVWTSDNFISLTNSLTFSPYEKEQIEKYNKATPTDVEKKVAESEKEADSTDELDGLDYESLLN